MKFKDTDFNTTMPHGWKQKKIKEGNNALDIAERLNQQIDHWERLPDGNIYKQIMLDELYYLRDGKI